MGLPEENFFFYGEDADLSLRIMRAGWRIQLLGGARVIHLVSRSAGPEYRETSFEGQQSILYFFYKNRSRVVFRLAKALRLLGVLRRLASCLITFKGRNELEKTWDLFWQMWKVRSFPPPGETRPGEEPLAGGS